MLQLMLYQAYLSIGCLIRYFVHIVINKIIYSQSGLFILKSILSLNLDKNKIFYNVVHYFLTWQCCTSSARTWITDWGPPFTPNRSSSSNASRAACEEQRRKGQVYYYKDIYFYSLYLSIISLHTMSFWICSAEHKIQ